MLESENWFEHFCWGNRLTNEHSNCQSSDRHRVHRPFNHREDT